MSAIVYKRTPTTDYTQSELELLQESITAVVYEVQFNWRRREHEAHPSNGNNEHVNPNFH